MPDPNPKADPERRTPPGPMPARELAIKYESLSIIAALHDVGPAPLAELQRRYGESRVERARRTGLIQATETLAGALYAPSRRGRAALQLDRSGPPPSPDALIYAFMRRVTHTVMTQRGWRPVPAKRGPRQPQARAFWQPAPGGGERTCRALASPYGPPPVTVQRALDRCGPCEPLHLMPWEREPYIELARSDPRLRVTRIDDLIGELPAPLWSAVERLRSEIVADEAAA